MSSVVLCDTSVECILKMIKNTEKYEFPEDSIKIINLFKPDSVLDIDFDRSINESKYRLSSLSIHLQNANIINLYPYK